MGRERRPEAAPRGSAPRAGRALLELAALLCLACGPSRDERARLLVFGAASLTESFTALAAAFERAHPEVRVDLHFAGTAQLVLQVREGAPADVLAAADETSMQRVVDAGLALEPPVPFARNRLTIVSAPGNPARIAGLPDLARADVRVALCGPEVPAGRYARQALASAGVAVRSVSDEPSVRALLGKLLLGEVDAGIVYATDAQSLGQRVTAIPLPAEFQVVATYPIAALGGGAVPDLAREFVAFATSDAGRAVLLSFGFDGP